MQSVRPTVANPSLGPDDQPQISIESPELSDVTFPRPITINPTSHGAVMNRACYKSIDILRITCLTCYNQSGSFVCLGSSQQMKSTCAPRCHRAYF